MINIILTTLLCVIIISLIFVIIEVKLDKKHDINKISFKESMDLLNLPVLTLKQDDKKYNFLLDTGSQLNHINSKLISNNEINFTEDSNTATVRGMEGNAVNCNNCNITFTLNNNEFKDKFIINDLEAVFTNIKKTSGVTLHGILGSVFFTKYKYILDFDKQIAYNLKQKK